MSTALQVAAQRSGEGLVFSKDRMPSQSTLATSHIPVLQASLKMAQINRGRRWAEPRLGRLARTVLRIERSE
jgi:hypothetical protein